MGTLAQQVTARGDWPDFITSETLPVMLFCILLALVAVVAIVALHWKRVRIAETEAGLKLKMLERGYSADEIAKVLQAGIATGHHKRRHPPSVDQGCCASDFIRGGAST